MKSFPRSRPLVSKTSGYSRIAVACAAVLIAGGVAKGAGTTYALPDGSLLGWEQAPWMKTGGDSIGLFPNAAGDSAAYTFSNPATTALDRTGGAAITIGTLTVGGAGNWTITNGTASGFVFDNTGSVGNAMISTTSTGALNVAPDITIQNTNLDVSAGTSTGTITLSGSIGGTGGLTKSGAGYVILAGSTSNTFVGDTAVASGNFTGQLSLQKAGGVIAVTGDLIMDGTVSGTSAGVGTAGNTVRNQFGQQFAANSVIRFTNNTSSRHAYFSLYGNDQTVAGISETVANGGIVQVSQLEAFSTDATLTINNSADFSFAGYLRDVSANGTGKLAIIKTGAGRQALVGDKITYGGPTTLNGGTLELVNAINFRSAVTFGAGSTGVLQLASSSLTVLGLASDDALNNSAIVQTGASNSATLLVNQAGDTSFGGVLQNNGTGVLSLRKAGAGTLTLAGNNTYTGTTTLSNGTLSLGSANALGAVSTISFEGGALQFTAANTTDYSPRFSTAAGQVVRIDTNGQTVTLAGNLTSSTGSLTKEGAGTLILTGTNTFDSNTTITAGVLQIGSAGALNGTNNLIFSSDAPVGTKLRLSGFDVSVGTVNNSGLSGAAPNAVIENGSSTTDATLTVVSGRDNSFAGVLQDGGAARLNFTREGGATTLTLSGASTYTGVTTLRSGILAVTTLTDGGAASGIGAASSAAGNLVLDGGVLSYAGSGAATTNRSFTLGATGGLGADGATPADTVTFTETTPFSFLGAGAHTLLLRGANTGDNTLATQIVDSDGATSLTKLDGGTWVLTNAETYTGATTISGGRLVVTNALGATNVTVSGGALAGTGTIGLVGGTTGVTLNGGSTPETRGLIDLIDRSIGTLTLQGAATATILTLGGSTGNAAGLRFEIGSGGTSDTVAISGGKVLANDGGARVDVTGLSGFNLGTYDLLTFGSGQATGLNNLYLGDTAGGGYSYSLVQSATALQLMISAAATSAAWAVNADGNWFDGSNWTGGVAPNGTGASATFGSVITAPRSVTLNSSATVGTLTFNSPNSYTLASSGGSILALNNNGAGAAIPVTTGQHVISAPLALTEATTAAINGAALTISGAIGGTGRLIKTGPGLLVLNASNTYGGGTTINGGTVRIAADNNLGAAPANFTADNIVLDGGILRTSTGVTFATTRGFQIGANGGTFYANGGNFTVQSTISDQGPGAGALTITGTALYVINSQSTYSGGTILQGMTVPQSSTMGPAGAPTSGPYGTGTLTFSTGSQIRATSAIAITLGNNVVLDSNVLFLAGNTVIDKDLTFTGGVTLTGTRTLTLQPSIRNNLTTFSGAISDGGNGFGLIATGGGALVLGGANTFTGGLMINAGTVIAQTDAGALGGAGTGGVLLGDTTGSASASLLFSDDVTYANPITVRSGSSGTTTIGNRGGAAPVLSGAITLNKALTLASSSAGSLTVSGPITGSAALTVTGSSGNFIQLAGDNAGFTGNVGLASGTLKIGATTALGAANAVAVSAGATLELNGVDATIGGLNDGTGSGSVNDDAATVNTLTVAGSGSYAFAGVLSGTTPANFALTKAGSGTQTLSGLSTYTGATTVNAGTLLLDLGTNTTGVLAATSAPTLGGGTLTIQGASAGMSSQTLGDLTLTANTSSTIVIDTHGGAGTTLTLGSNWTRGADSTLLIDLSSSTSAVVTSNPASLLSNGILDFVVVTDTTGTGFGTISGGNIVRAVGNELLANSNDAAVNFVTKIGDTDYAGNTLTMLASPTTHATNSLTIDTSAGSGVLNLNGTTLSLTSGTVLVTGANDFAIQSGTLGASASAVTINQVGSGNLTVSGAVSGGAGSLTKNGTGTVTLTGSNTYIGVTTINEGTLAVSGGSAIGNSSVVTLANEPTAIFQVNGSEVIGSLSGGGTSGGNVVISAGTLTTNEVSGVSNTYSGIISGAGGFTKNGAVVNSSSTPNLILGGANTYGGATNVTNGSLRITNASALGNTGSITTTTVDSGGRLELSGGITVVNESLTISGSGGNNQGALQSVSGDNTWAGQITLGAGITTRLGANGTGSLTISGNITGSNTSTLAIRTAQTGSAPTNPVIISGSGNDYGGNTDVVVGTLQLAGGVNRLPIGTVVRMGNTGDVSFARFDLNGQDQEIAGLTSLGSTPAAVNVATVTSASPATLTINNSSALTYKGAITGALTIIKTGSGTETLGAAGFTAGATNYTGSTTITGGTLRAAVASVFSANSAVSLANVSGAALDLANFNQRIGSLAGGGTTGGNVALGGATLTTGGDGTSTSYAGTIAGTNGKIVKEGAGSFGLNGVNTYTGGTTVKAGALVVGGSIAGSIATVGDSVNAVTAAVLMGGTGTVSGTAAIAGISAITSGARVDAGLAANTAGVLNTGTFSLTNNAHVSFHIGGATVGGNSTTGYDRVNVLGGASASLSGGTIDLFDITTGVGQIAPDSILFLVVNNGGGSGSTLPATITLNGTPVTDLSNIVISGLQFSLVNDANFDGFTGLSGGMSSGGNDVALLAVPEPTALLTLLMGSSLLAGVGRFRRRS